MSRTRKSGAQDIRIYCIHCNTLQHTATHCNTLQHTKTTTHEDRVRCHERESRESKTLALECIVTSARFFAAGCCVCNSVHDTAAHTRLKRQIQSHAEGRVSQGALRCSVLQCVAVCCSVLQCVAVCCSVYSLTRSVVNTSVSSYAHTCPQLMYVTNPYVYHEL